MTTPVQRQPPPPPPGPAPTLTRTAPPPAPPGPPPALTTPPSTRLGTARAPKPYGTRQRPVPVKTLEAGQLMTGFSVVVDGVELPTFTECSGLAAEYAVEPWVEGGQNEFVHQLPGRISFTPVTLSRHVDGASGMLAAWFSSVADPAQPYRTARISAVDAAGRAIARWDLSDVFASKYTGPSFSSGSAAVATESVELVHHGFSFAFAPGGAAGPSTGGSGASTTGRR